LMALHKISGHSQSSTAILRCDRSTTRLGLGGLILATAEYMHFKVLLVSLL
jgi:hypothetical protein